MTALLLPTQVTKAEWFALQLRYLGGLNTNEIAHAMSWTTAEVRALHNRALHLVTLTPNPKGTP